MSAGYVIGAGLMAASAVLLVVLASRRARDRRVRRLRVEARKAAYRQGSARVWPWAEPMPPLPGRVYRSASRDVGATAVMARFRGGGRG